MSIGQLQISTLSASDAFPVDAVTLTITPQQGQPITLVTDANGYGEAVELDAPEEKWSLDEADTTVLPYSICSVKAQKQGWLPYQVDGVQIFANQRSLLTIPMEPAGSEAPADLLPNALIPTHSLFAGGGGSGPAPGYACQSQPLVLTEVVIPEKITVHLGKPAASASNVTVSFRDYIKNVASSEIYPTWPTESLKANIYAQISLALNRIYTEWYPSKGYTFNITNSTSYDQYYVHGRNIFESISQVVDDIFNVYIRKTGTVNPYYAEYCDGKIVPNCPGMKQWGTKTLADQGYSAIRILRYYYGNDVELVSSNNIAAIPESYPGTPLRVGASGTAVSTIQRQLNRIAKNYPAFGTLTVNGRFDEATEAVVKRFQKQFSLTADGVVGKATWYKISYIYVSVKKLAELTSEGEQATGIPSTGTYPGTALKAGSTGTSVKQVQFWLSVLSQFYSSIPNLSVDGVFGAGTTRSVKAFQTMAGLSVDGVVGRATWNALYEYYMSVENDILLPGTGWVGEYPGTPLKTGSTGNEVRLAQFWLSVISDFYNTIPSISPDGIFGSATRAAVVAFQNRFSITADGIIGPQTWNKLFEVYSDLVNGVLEANETPGEYPGTPLKLGSRGIKVKELQFYLYLLSAYYPSIPRIAFDGIFGAATQEAVMAYQKIAGLKVDGIVGSATWQSVYTATLRLRNSDGPTVRYQLDGAPAGTVGVGDTGNLVVYIQWMLTLVSRYYDKVTPPGQSGSYDVGTEASVLSFQRLWGLAQTGSVDETTWNALLQEVTLLLDLGGGERMPDTGVWPGYVMGPDSAGPAVAELQSYMNGIASMYCGADFLAEDGWYGPETEQAVHSFQQAFGLPVTDAVDEITWNTIVAYYYDLANKPATTASGSIKIFVYNQNQNAFYIYYRNLSDPMPYSAGTTLKVREFRGSSKSNVLWTTTRAMESWNETRRTYGSGIPVGYAFKRIWEGGHGTTSQHYAGVAFDVGQSLTQTKRNKIWNTAKSLGVWGYVEPLSMTPTWVHFDRRYGTPACGGTAGYPTCRRGSKNTYVLILQDALNALGYSTKTLDGIFGSNTETAVKAFQRANSLSADGICGCNTWKKLASAVVGIGRTTTVID